MTTGGPSGGGGRDLVAHRGHEHLTPTQEEGFPRSVLSSSMVEDDALVSVVVACWNAAATLAEQLSALELQDDDGPWELIVVDNGSTDSSLEILNGYASRLPLSVIRATERRGPGYARNVGVEHARGANVAFCDADDVVAPDWLRQMRAALAKHPFVAGRFRGDLLNKPWVTEARSLDQQSGLQQESWLCPLTHAGAGNMGVSRRAFLAIGGFDAGALYLEDTDLCWRLQMSGIPLVWAPEVVIQVRLRASLHAVYRQAVASGRGSRWLQRRYAGVLDGDSVVVPAPDPAASPSETPAYGAHGGASARGRLGALLWSVGWHIGFLSLFGAYPVGDPGRTSGTTTSHLGYDEGTSGSTLVPEVQVRAVNN